MLFKLSKFLLIASSIIWVIVSVFTVTFCIIRFVLPISLPKNSENLLIFIIPSSIIQAAISAAGLCASLSTLFWPVFCYALVLTIPFSVSMSWIYSLLQNYSSSYETEYYVILSILIVANLSWFLQITCSLYISWNLKGNKNSTGVNRSRSLYQGNPNQLDLNFCTSGQYVSRPIVQPRDRPNLQAMTQINSATNQQQYHPQIVVRSPNDHPGRARNKSHRARPYVQP